MKLSSTDLDALNELFNIGLHRAAASLSDLTHQRVLVDLPKLWVCTIPELHERLGGLLSPDLATVHQTFGGGAVAGDAILVLEYDKAALLANLMTSGDAAIGGRLDQSAKEVLSEIGNVVLSSCLGAFGNVLQLPVAFAIPRLHLQSLDGLIQSIETEVGDIVSYALVAATLFRLSELEVSGYLVVVIGVTSLERVSLALNERAG